MLDFGEGLGCCLFSCARGQERERPRRKKEVCKKKKFCVLVVMLCWLQVTTNPLR